MSRPTSRLTTAVWRWSATRRNLSTTGRALADHIRIVEVGPRDGLQNEKTSIPVATKIDLIRRLAKTGVRTIEAGSFVHPKWVPQVGHKLAGMSVL